MATICASPIFLPEAHVYMVRLAYFMRGAYGSYAPQNSFPPIAFSLVVIYRVHFTYASLLYF